jgi:uncharacterized protein YceH (UPF0502 family)
MAEVGSLKGRVDTLIHEVGVPHAALHKKGTAGAGKRVVLDKPALLARYKELLRTRTYADAALKEDVTTLQAECADLRTKILMLDNQVEGGAVLFASYAYSPTSLSSQVEAVEKDVTDFRSRVSSLEQALVTGLLQKKTKASLLETSAEKTDLGPFASRLTTLETEVASLQQRAEHMATMVQGGSAGAILAEDLGDFAAPVKPHGGQMYASLLEESLGEGTIKERTASLESSVASLKSTLETLENQVSGKSSTGDAEASLLEVQHSKGGSGTSLKARIVSLEVDVDSLRTRVSNLEHVVEG